MTEKTASRPSSEINEAFLSAARSGRLDRLLMLLPLANPDAQTPEGRTALANAAKMRRADCVRALIGKTNARLADKDGNTALIWAAFEGEPECVKLLIPHSDANATDSSRKTALMWAAEAGCEKSVQALIPVSDASLRDIWGNTALMAAAANGHADVLRALMAASDILAQNENGETALIEACGVFHPDGLECIGLLARAMGAGGIERKDNSQRDALDHIVESKRWEALDIFIGLASPQRLDRALEKAGAINFPRWAAHREAEAIASAAGLGAAAVQDRRLTGPRSPQAPNRRPRAL